MSLFFENPMQPVLALPTDQTCWQRSKSISDPAARWRSYVHQLGLKALTVWFEEEFEQTPAPWPNADPFDVWYVVDGLMLLLGDIRIVVILSETISAAELNVPQEWVDLPELSADYYIAAHVDVDNQRLALWGYTTHSLLRERSAYDAVERKYFLGDIDLIQDFSTFLLAQPPNRPTPLHQLVSMSTAHLESLVQSLAYVPEPRLELPFNQWGTIFSSDRWREQLYQLSQTAACVSIEDWLENIFEQGWQPLGSLLSQSSTPTFRSTAGGTAVLTCGKKIFLNTSPDDLLLMFSVDIEANKRRNIRIQLYPSGDTILPSNVMLALELSETGELLKTVKAGEHDDYIQIPPFRCSAGQRLRVHIQLADSICQEEFVS